MKPSDENPAATAALQSENDRLRVEIEDLLETQRELEATRESYRELFDCAPLAWISIDVGGAVQNMNRAAITLLGFGRAQLLRAPLAASVDQHDRQKLREHLLAARSSDELQRCDLRLATGEADLVPVRLTTRRAPALDGNLVIILLDLRENQAAESERRRLEQAERDARAANEAKDTFIAMLSHELRTPLTPVLAAASALADVLDIPEELRSTLAMIQRNVAAEVKLIDDLLDLTRIAHGKMHVDKEPVDLHALCRDVTEGIRPDAQQTELAIVLDFAAARHWVSGDPIRLRQVFHNLLSNALKFTSAGDRIELRSWNREDHLLVEVSDNGRGIDAATLPKLFQPFEQALQESMGSAKGLGLGLPICRGILEQHDAKISASSAGLGRGARFVVEIRTIEPPTVRANTRSTAPPAPLKTLRVLLVEDHEDTAEIFERFLRRGGYVVHVAHSVQSALAVDPKAFDLVLSDVGLVDGTGLELMRALRKTGDVKGIALSGYGTESDVRASKEAGFAFHLTKPVNFNDLLEAIGKLEL